MNKSTVGKAVRSSVKDSVVDYIERSVQYSLWGSVEVLVNDSVAIFVEGCVREYFKQNE
jgi:hypothetical protein